MTETTTKTRLTAKDVTGAPGHRDTESRLQLLIPAPLTSPAPIALRPATTAVVPRNTLTLASARKALCGPIALSKPRIAQPLRVLQGLRLREPQSKSYAGVQRGFADDDRGERILLELPFGMPRFVNAPTLKALVGADRSAVLFRKVGRQFEICPDSYQIDLEDGTQLFRVGRVQVYS